MLKRSLTLLFVLVLAFHAMVPNGFMLASAASDGSMTVVVCTGYGLKTLTVDQDGQPASPGQEQGKKAGLCDYATVGAAVTASDAPPRLSSTVQFAAITYRTAVTEHRLTRIPGAISARGPPSVA